MDVKIKRLGEKGFVSARKYRKYKSMWGKQAGGGVCKIMKAKDRQKEGASWVVVSELWQGATSEIEMGERKD